MVTEYGMSAKLGAVKFGTGDGEPFLGRDMGHQRDYSEDDRRADRRRGARADRGGARRGLGDPGRSTATCSTTWCCELMDKETLTKDDLERILAPVRKRPPHNASFRGFGKRTPPTGRRSTPAELRI